MQTEGLTEFAGILGVSAFNERACHRCLKLYNEDVDVLDNSSSILGPDGEELIQSLNILVTDTATTFHEYYCARFSGSKYWARTDKAESCLESLNTAVENGYVDDSGLMCSTKQLALYCLVLIIEGATAPVVFSAMEFLLKLCYLPGASAFGIGNINVMSVVCGKFYKFVMSDISGRPIGTGAIRGSGRKSRDISKGTENADHAAAPLEDAEVSDMDSDSDSDVEEVGQRSSQRTLRARSKVNYNEAVAKAPVAVASELCPRFISILALFTATSKSPRGRVDKHAADLEAGASPLISLLTERTQHPNLDVFMDGLVALAVANSANTKFSKACVSSAETVLLQFVHHSNSVFVRVVRSLLPLLSCDSTDTRCAQFKGDQKTSKRDVGLCFHGAAVKLMTQYISTHVSFDVSDCVETDEEGSGAAPVGVDGPTAFMCSVLGCIERIVLRCGGDTKLKGSPRAAVLRSVKTLLGAAVIVLLNSGILEHFTHLCSFLQFLMKYSRSSTPQARMFAVEVIVGTVAPRGSWMWSEYVATEGFDVKTMRLELFQCVLKRCTDSSPLVRHKSIAVLQEFVIHQELGVERDSSISTEDQEHAQFAYCLVSGQQYCDRSFSREAETTDLLCFLDVVRDLCVVSTGDANKSALVRSKALQALSACLCRSYIYHSPGAGVPNPASVHVSRDDVTLFVLACANAAPAVNSDIRSVGSSTGTTPSIVVKKQAVQSLTELVRFRPMDVELQDAWLAHVLPLVYDGESTVVTAVAKAAMELFFVSLVAWFNDYNNLPENDSGSVSSGFCWSIYGRLHEMNRAPLLKTTIQHIIAHDLMPTASSVAVIDAALVKVEMREKLEFSVVAVVLALQTACKSQQRASPQDGSHGVVSSEYSWLMLELLLANDRVTGIAVSLKISDILNHLGKLSTSNSAFIVQCWYNKRGYDASTGLCSTENSVITEDELCLLGILLKLSNDVSVADAKVVSSQLLAILMSLPSFGGKAANSGNHISKLVNALYVLTVRHSYADGAGVKKPKASINPLQLTLACIYDEMLLWVDSLVGVCSDVLRVYGQTRCTKSLGADGWAEVGAVKSTTSLPDTYVRQTVDDYLGYMQQHSSVDSEYSLSAEITKMNELVSVALLILGEVVMLGFTREEEEDNYRPLNGAVRASGAATYVVSSVTQSVKFGLSTSVATTIKLVAMSSTDDGKIKAMALIAMGKLCMRSKATSRSCLNLFLREIQLPDSLSRTDTAECSTVATRTNSLLILSDMCVRYTNLIEPHIHTIAACLQDFEVTIRKNTFIMLIQLVLQDYVKLKGPLLHRLLLCTLDADEEFQEFVKETLRSSVLNKYPNFVLQHFTETIVVCNGCSAHPAHQCFHGDLEVDSKTSQLSGNSKQGRRFKIYAFLLSTLVSDEQKIHITAKVCHDILSWVVDNNQLCAPSVTTAALENVVKDSFVVLQSPLISVQSVAGVAADVVGTGVDDDCAPESGSALLAKAKSKILVQVSKQHMVDTILPVLFSLKHVVEAAKSPLQRGLTEYLTHLYRTNSKEMDHALNSEPILQAELLYDIQLHEAEVQKQKQKRLEQLRADVALESQHTDLIDMQLEYVHDAPPAPTPSLSVAATPAPPRTPGQAALSAHRVKTGDRSSFGSGKLCPPSIRKVDLPIGDSVDAPTKTPSLLSSDKSTRTPNDLLQAVGSQLRVRTASPYAKLASHRKSISRPSAHLKCAPTNTEPLDGSDFSDPMFGDFDPQSGVSGNNFTSLSRTTTRRLSWSVTVNNLNEDGCESPSRGTPIVSIKSPGSAIKSAAKRDRSEAKAVEAAVCDPGPVVSAGSKRSRMGPHAQTASVLEMMNPTTHDDTASKAVSAHVVENVAPVARRKRVGTNSLATILQQD